METQTQSVADEQDIIDALYEYAAALMRAGKSNQEVADDLVGNGLDKPTADVVVNNLDELRKEQTGNPGFKNMSFGALWCIGGVIAVLVTYGAASSGGTHMVAWGAILFGALQICQGVYQSAYSR